ncbi:hypothetical protein [Hyalangium gracile]|uniref:hypothetical protein n=1 Tax=Hyalangium gracile TaxID=394092 RepID=UPI001CCE4C61|nr:hypothetical protein [Hyalangium gracile]
MNPFDELIAEAASANVQLTFSSERRQTKRALSPAEIVFHTPIIALTLLAVAFSEERFYTGELSRWAGNMLAQLCYGSTKPAHNLEWSLLLHARCAEALVFLESVGFVVVTGDTKREIVATPVGRAFVRNGTKGANAFGQLLRDLLRAHSFVRARGLSLL